MRMRMMMIRLVMLRRRHRITTDLRVRFGLYEYIYYGASNGLGVALYLQVRQILCCIYKTEKVGRLGFD